MSHPFAYDAQGDALGFGRRGPAVACHIERDVDVSHAGYCLEIVVDVVACVEIGISLVDCVAAYDGEEIASAVFRIFVEQMLHLGCPFYHKLLTCLAASVSKIAVAQVALAQKRHVDEAHAAEYEAH